MVLDKISSGLKKTLEKITRAGYVDEEVIEEVIQNIERNLLRGDVDVNLVYELSEKIRKRSLDEKPKPGLTTKQHVINVVYEELVRIMGKEKEVKLKPGKVLLLGLFGAGKTTTSGKLAKYYRNHGIKPGLVGCDVHRPASMDQIKQIGENLNIPYYISKKEGNPVKIAKKGEEKLDCEVLIFDSAGRNALDKELGKELKELEETINPSEVLLTIPADLGQKAGEQAKEFNKLVGITGIIVTKMDASAKGGGALTSSNIVKAPVKFIGTGEKLDEIEVYDPKRFVSRLIGFGDLKGLLEKAQKEGVEERAEKMLKGEFTLEDFYDQIDSITNMGSLDQILDMVPGMPKKNLPDNFLQVQEEKLERFKYILDSMTPEEKRNPKTIGPSRINRISKGSGTSEEEVRELLKMYNQGKKAMKMFKGGKRKGQIKQMLKQFGLG